MTEHEKVHYLTEAIFKNILENYNPGVKQLITSGRALQKALHSVATHAKTYIECVYTLAQSAQVCKGATSEIGAALVQIAEVHKEINTQVVDNIKSFHSDLLIPLETKQENDFKHLQLIHKKYATGHKLHNSVYEKSQSALKKHKKKAKAKFGFDQKELQYAREVKENLQKLEDYQFQNLRLALMEERKRYCFLLDRICAMVRNYASHHSKAHEMLTHRLSEWSELCKTPHLLPSSSESVINAFRNQDDLYNTPEEPDFERRSSSDYNGSEPRQSSNNSGSNGNHGDDNNSFTYGTAHRLQNMLLRANGTTEGSGTGLTSPYASTGMFLNGGMMGSPEEFSVPGGMTIPAPQTRVQVRALYTHSGMGETQLSFVTGDCITLVGDEKDGWQYGENARTRRVGWFPVSFTEPISEEARTPTRDFRLTTQRVKSLSNLHESGLQDPYHLSLHQSSGHSDSDSNSVKLRARHRENNVGMDSARPMSMHGSIPTSLQIPQRNRFGDRKLLPTSPEDRSPAGSVSSGGSNSPWGSARRLSYHPRQPSIPEDNPLSNNTSPTTDDNDEVINPSAYRMLVPSPTQRHTLAFSASPTSDIYLGRRNSAIECQLRSNSLAQGANQYLQRLKERGIGQRTSFVAATDLAITRSPQRQIPEITCIPPPEEFRDISQQQQQQQQLQQQLEQKLQESQETNTQK